MGSTVFPLLLFNFLNEPRLDPLTGEDGSLTGEGMPALPCISSSAVHMPLSAIVIVLCWSSERKERVEMKNLRGGHTVHLRCIVESYDFIYKTFLLYTSQTYNCADRWWANLVPYRPIYVRVFTESTFYIDR